MNINVFNSNKLKIYLPICWENTILTYSKTCKLDFEISFEEYWKFDYSNDESSIGKSIDISFDVAKEITEKLLSMLDTKKIRFEEAVARDKEILKLTGQAEEYETLKAALYTDLRDNLITREQFNRYREIYADRLEEIYRAKKVQEELVREIYEKGVATGAWLEKFKENMEITEPDRVLLVFLTDRILIYENKTVEIIFKYRNELQKAAQILSEAAAIQEKAVEMKEDEKVKKTDMPVCNDVLKEVS